MLFKNRSTLKKAPLINNQPVLKATLYIVQSGFQQVLKNGQES